MLSAAFVPLAEGLHFPWTWESHSDKQPHTHTHTCAHTPYLFPTQWLERQNNPDKDRQWQW